MSLLPDSWSMVPLGQVATLQRGFDLPVQARDPGQVPIFAANGPVGTHTEAKVTGPGVVTGRSGTLGQVHFVDSDFWPLNTALWVKNFHGNDPRWIFRLLAWLDLKQFTRGAGVPTLNRNLVHVVEVPLPPLAEQKRIAAILDAADGLRAKRSDSLAQLDTLLQSAFLDMFGDPVTNPKGWEICPLEKATTRVTDGTHQSPNWSDSGLPFLFVSNIRNRQIDFETSKFISESEWEMLTSRCPIEVGDLLYTTVGSYGNPAVVKEGTGRFAFQRHIAHIKPRHDLIDAQFLEIMLDSPLGRNQANRLARGVAQKTLNLRELKSFQIFLPPLNEQQRFAAIVESVEKQKSRLREHLAELDALFASLQQRAFNGEL